MSFLVLSGLHKTYADGTEAVKGIDLSCEEGEFVVLLGPSGCGKTTTLRMVAGLETPTGGQIRLAGDDIGGLSPTVRDVGFVFQFYALYPHMSVRHNIGFPLENMGVPRRQREEQVVEVIQRLGLETLAGLYPDQLSGGDQQRVALARAMVRRPHLYLMDEPLGTLDADLRLEMRELIRAQQLEMGITTIYVTHDQEEAMSLADRVVIMEEGRIHQHGPPAAVYDRPADLFVAHFMGSPGMNFIEGEMQPEAGRCCFVARDGGMVLSLERRIRPGHFTLGVRPEFVRRDEHSPFRGRVVMDEYLGTCRNIHLDTPCGRLVMRAGVEEKQQVGEEISLGFDPEHMRFFDAASGESV